MAKKINIDVDFTEDTYLVGISCHKKDYFLAFQLNDQLGTDLRRYKDLPYYNSKINSPLNYALFYYHHPENHLGYYLISNFNQENKLFSELKTIDFFVLLQGLLSEEGRKDLLTKIRGIKGVLFVQDIETKKIKDYSNFLSDLELHITDIFKQE